MNNIISIMFTGVLLCTTRYAIAQTNHTQTERQILRLDSLFWQAYNQCDTIAIDSFFSPDLEFYHDKGGITKGNRALRHSISNNLCGNRTAFVLRREVVPSSLQLFPMYNQNQLYAYLLSGEHLFFEGSATQSPTLSGKARFTHLWRRYSGGSWRMTRIISYDHQPAH